MVCVGRDYPTMPTAIVPAADGSRFAYGSVDPAVYRWNLNGCRQMYFPVTTNTAVADTFMTGQSVVAVAWSPATADDGVTIAIAAGHPSSMALWPRGGVARTGVLLVWLKSGKRPTQNDTNSITDIASLRTAQPQEPYRQRLRLKRRFFYIGADLLTGDTSYTWTPGIYKPKHVYWYADSFSDDIAPTLNTATGQVTFTAPNTNAYAGTLVVESVR